MEHLFFPFFILYLLTLSFCEAFDMKDCFYDEAKSHAEYICNGPLGMNFQKRTNEYLYCNNYFSTGIDREKIQWLSFSGCHERLFPKKFLLKNFKTLRILNISSCGLEGLYEKDLQHIKYLEKLLASHNQLSDLNFNLLVHAPGLVEVDFSNNHIKQVDSLLFASVRRLKHVNISSNLIEKLDIPIFSNLQDLEILDLSNNLIEAIESDLFGQNLKLEKLFLNDNKIKGLDCSFLSAWTHRTHSHSLNIFINSLEELNTSSSELNITTLPNKSTTLRISDHNIEWTFSKGDFVKLRHLNLSRSKTENVLEKVKMASPLLASLDISFNFIGALNASTFGRFTDLKILNLRQTNISNFQFATVYHLSSLRSLDISYNNLNKTDFYMFLRNFENLESLYLEGNNLTEIDSITHSHFPKLSSLGISKNSFSCEYLVKFLLEWPNLKLINNPLEQPHVGGVECLEGNSLRYKNVNLNRKMHNLNNVVPTIVVSRDLLVVIAVLLAVILIALSLILVLYFIKNWIPYRKNNRTSDNPQSSMAQHELAELCS